MKEDIFNPTPDLPQNRVTLRDGVRNKGAENRTSDKVVLLGTATDGPVLEPITIENKDDAMNIFGRYFDENGMPNGATLTRFTSRLLDDDVNDPDNITLMRISGKEAEGEIELYPETKRDFVEEELYLGEVRGNDDYVIHISIPDGEHEVNGISFDDARINNVSIQGDGTPLPSGNYKVKNNVGDILLYEDATNPGANLYIEYIKEHIRRIEITEELHSYDEGSQGEEYKLDNENIIPDTETVYISPDPLDDPDGAWTKLDKEDYEFNFDTGILNLDQDIYSEPNVHVDYTYEEIETEEETMTHTINGGTQYLYLEHNADPRKDLEVTADGEPLNPRYDYDVNYDRLSVTVIELNEDSPRVTKGSKLRVNYYWQREETFIPAINVRSIYGGSLYNNVRLQARDKLTLKNDRIVKDASISGSEEMLVDINNDNVYYFPNEERGIIKESVELKLIHDSKADNNLTIENDFTVNESKGIVTVPDSIVEDINVNGYTLVTTAYSYTEVNERPFTTVKGDYDRDNLEYTGETLDKENREEAIFENRNIVPNSIDLVMVEDGTETSLAEGTDYEVNYSDGIIEVTSDSVYPLDSSKKLIANEYKYYNVSGKELTVIKPASKAKEDTSRRITFDLTEDYTNVASLIQAINNHRDNNVIRVSADDDTMRTSTMMIKTPDRKVDIDGDIIPEEFDMSGGKDEVDLSKEEIYDKLGGKYNDQGEKIELGAYDVLKDYNAAKYVVPLGVYANDDLDNDKNFAQQLANFCASTFYANNELFGYIGFKPLQEPSQVNVIDRVREAERFGTDFFLQNKDGEYLTDNNNNYVDAGKTISIVNLDLRVNDPHLVGTTIENAAPMIAGIHSTLTRVNSISNEAFGVGTLAYQLSPRQQQRLLRNKIMCGRNVYGEPRIVEGRTCAVKESGWELSQTIDIAYDTMEDLRAIYDKYSGDGNSLPKRNSLDAEIEQSLKENPGLVDFEHELIMTSKDRRIGRMIVRLYIVPVSEFRQIHTVVSINEEL